MEIVDLSEDYHKSYFHCLEEWSSDMVDAGDHKMRWYGEMKEKGVRVKLAIKDGEPCGVIQYLPVEQSQIAGQDLYFILCIWVHGHRQGVGKQQGRGIGTALLEAAEADVKSMGRSGIAAWGLSLPFWMKASWFKRHGFKRVDKNGLAVLLWKPFREEAQAPAWIREKKGPQAREGIVTVSSFVNGWCPLQNLVHERAKRAALTFGDRVEFQTFETSVQSVFCEWGISDALFIDGKPVRTGPPPSYEKILRLIAKRVRKQQSA